MILTNLRMRSGKLLVNSTKLKINFYQTLIQIQGELMKVYKQYKTLISNIFAFIRISTMSIR